jgi:hypothetical protein
MIEVYGTTFACGGEVKRGMLVRRLAGFHVVVDVQLIEDDGVRICLDDGATELRQHHVGRGLDPNEDGATEFYRDETCRAVDRAFWLKVVDTVDAAMNEALVGRLVDKLPIHCADASS